MLVQGDLTLAQRIAHQLVFYVQRIPDQLTGPFVEVGTLYQHSAIIASIANLWAVLATAVIVGGWARALRTAATPAGRARPTLHARDSGRLAVHRGGAVSDSFDSKLTRRRGRGPRGTGWRLQKTNGVVATTAIPAPVVGGLSGPGRVGAVFRLHARYGPHPRTEGDRSRLRRGLRLDRRPRRPARPDPLPPPGRSLLADRSSVARSPRAKRPGDVNANIDADTVAIERTIETYGVSYLLIDQDRYTNAPTSPLAHFVALAPGSRSQGLEPRDRALVDLDLRGPVKSLTEHSPSCQWHPPGFRSVSATCLLELPSSTSVAFESEFAVIFVAVEARLGQRSASS